MASKDAQKETADKAAKEDEVQRSGQSLAEADENVGSTGGDVVNPKPNPNRGSEEVVVYLGSGERLSYPGGRTLTPDEWDEVKNLKGEARDGSQVQLLVKGGGS